MSKSYTIQNLSGETVELYVAQDPVVEGGPSELAGPFWLLDGATMQQAHTVLTGGTLYFQGLTSGNSLEISAGQTVQYVSVAAELQSAWKNGNVENYQLAYATGFGLGLVIAVAVLSFRITKLLKL